MGYALKVPGGLLSMCYTHFTCPICEKPHEGDDYAEALYKSKRGYIYRKCTGCKRRLFITSDIKGDIVACEP